MLFRSFNDPSQELSRAVALAIVESSGNVKVGLALCEIMLASRKDRIAGLVIESTGHRDLGTQFLEWEVLARWKATSKRDDAWVLQVLRSTLQRARLPSV